MLAAVALSFFSLMRENAENFRLPLIPDINNKKLLILLARQFNFGIEQKRFRQDI
jgi:hypothetical protein